MTKTIFMLLLLFYDFIELYMFKASNFEDKEIKLTIYLIPIAMCIIGALG